MGKEKELAAELRQMRDVWAGARPEPSVRQESGRPNTRSVSLLQHLIRTLDSKIDIEEKFAAELQRIWEDWDRARNAESRGHGDRADARSISLL